MSAWFWGLCPPAPIDECYEKGVTDVRVTTYFWFQVLSVITLGVWTPMVVEWRCVKAPPPRPIDQ